MVTVGLVVPVLNNFKGFTRLMQSIDSPVIPLVSNNWDYNHGVAKGWNDGLIEAINLECDYALVCNDDVTFTQPATVTMMTWAMEKHSIDLLSPTNIRDGYRPLTQGTRVSEWAFGNEPDFSAFMIRPREFFGKFGEFDQNFYPAYFEDNDMAYRIKVAGGTYKNALGIGFLHEGSQTQNSVAGGIVPSPVFEKNRSYYYSKWGGLPGEEQFTTPFALDNMTIKDW